MGTVEPDAYTGLKDLLEVYAPVCETWAEVSEDGGNLVPVGVSLNNALTDSVLATDDARVPVSKTKRPRNGSIAKFRWTGVAYVVPSDLAKTKGFKDALNMASRIEQKQKAAS